MSHSPKINVRIKGAQANQDSLRESDLEGGNFTITMDASTAQRDALQVYLKAIQDGTDTSTVEAAINAL